MNCKQGELAIVVKSKCGNEGRIVRCISLHLPGEIVRASVARYVVGTPTWKVEGSLRLRWPDTGEETEEALAPDDNLRPIRDTDSEDETLTWAGKPQTKELIK